jgi:hypothetical protein
LASSPQKAFSTIFSNTCFFMVGLLHGQSGGYLYHIIVRKDILTNSETLFEGPAQE